MFFWKVRAFLKTVRALATALVVGVIVWSLNAVRLSKTEGERTFYLQSVSSQSLFKKQLSLSDVGRVTGESVTLTLGEGASAHSIIQLYEAEILFTEQTGELYSYYCYTDKWSDGVRIGEYFVNLHVAVEGERCVVGSPIIFGGF